MKILMLLAFVPVALTAIILLVTRGRQVAPYVLLVLGAAAMALVYAYKPKDMMLLYIGAIPASVGLVWALLKESD
jgi:cadmium resistance protein CadD (predicted permease)